MKANHLISLLQSGFTTIKVTFNSSGSGQQYTYKAKLEDNIQVGDYVVVARDDLTLTVGYVAGVDDFADIDTSVDFNYKWIVQKVDIAGYRQQLEVEQRFKKHLQTLQRQQVRTNSLAAFANQFAEGSAEREELDALINGTVTINQLVDKLGDTSAAAIDKT